MSEGRDPLFKGCTRPAMLLGVPIMPMLLVGGGIILLAMWIHLAFFLLLPVALVVMRGIVKHDDQQFRLLGLKFLCRVVYPNKNAPLWKCSAYSPVAFKKRK